MFGGPRSVSRCGDGNVSRHRACSAEDPLACGKFAPQFGRMFLRRHTKLAGDADYTYWSLVKTVRTAKGPRHELVAHLGKLTPEEAQQAREWSDLDSLLDGTPPAQQLPLDQPAPPPPAPLWRTADVPPKLSGANMCGNSAGCIWRWRCGGGCGCTRGSQTCCPDAASGSWGRRRRVC